MATKGRIVHSFYGVVLTDRELELREETLHAERARLEYFLSDRMQKAMAARDGGAMDLIVALRSELWQDEKLPGKVSDGR